MLRRHVGGDLDFSPAYRGEYKREPGWTQTKLVANAPVRLCLPTVASSGLVVTAVPQIAHCTM